MEYRQTPQIRTPQLRARPSTGHLLGQVALEKWLVGCKNGQKKTRGIHASIFTARTYQDATSEVLAVMRSEYPSVQTCPYLGSCSVVN